MITVISRCNQNKYFKFIASIRLAIPVMLALIIAVAVGTVIESLHNTEYARLALYNTAWFDALLALLAVNVFASMMSRYPWKFYQTGFVLTHIGIIIVLVGSWITRVYGIDGSMQIQEGQSQGVIVLPRLMVAYQFEGSPTLNSAVFQKTLFDKDESGLSFLNNKIGHVVTVEKFVPFAEIEKGYSSSPGETGPVGISFGLKSQFFDVKEWLHSTDNPTMQLGPATLKLIIDTNTPEPTAKKTSQIKKLEKQRNPAKSPELLIVVDARSGKEIKKISSADFKKKFTLPGGVSVEVLKSLQRAQVVDNKLFESEDPTSSPNPALELEVTQGSDNKKVREVLYAKFPNFSLNKDGTFGFRFRYQADLADSPAAQAEAAENSNLPAGHPVISDDSPNVGEAQPNSMPQIADGSNVVEFHVNRNTPTEVRVELWKQGKKISEKIMKEGDIFQTPWMGMQIFLGSISLNSESSVQVRSIRPQPGKNLPPSAVFLKPTGDAYGFWLTQGDVKGVQIAGRNVSIAFTNETVQLPFELMLKQFSKKDYPGTETPYSYESLVVHNRTQQETLISMNEPLKSDGYTLYQASFVMNPGQKPVSILSVNKDPGRPVIYLGSLLLCLGIAVFTLMRSRIYKKRTENPKS